MKPTLTQAKHFLKPIPREKRATAYKWAIDAELFRPREPYLALVSPQGHVEYNAKFVLGDELASKLEHGKWYTNQELSLLRGRPFNPGGSPQCVEKNIKKWRFEVQP